jgi:DNA-binding LacI/PurR family transcriptional regulator
MPTSHEVAEKAGVSSTTVSHVINQTRFVSPDTVKRVQDVMSDLGYRPNSLARSLRRGETHSIGLILPDSSNPFFAEVTHAIEAEAFLKGYSLILCNTDGDINKERRYTDVLYNKQIDGIIFMAAGDDTASLQELLKQGLPTVVVDRELDTLDVDSVISDNFQSGYLAATHFIEGGHEKIAIIRGPSNLTPSAKRVTGFCQALQDANISFDSDYLLEGDFHPKSGYFAAKKLLSLGKPPTAIFVCNDLMAMGVLRAVHEAGLTVPENISIIGHDNIELASYTLPGLTTIAQQIEKIGSTAFQLLLDRIHDENAPVKKVVLPNFLIERHSTRSLL